MPMSDKPVLYGYWRSSASWRVRIALEFNGIEYEYRPINLVKGEQASKEYLQINPAGLVPTLLINNLTLTQSLAIIDYLDHVDNTCTLMIPKDPILRAKVMELSLTISCDTHPLQNLRVLKGYAEGEERQSIAQSVISRGLQTFEQLLTSNGSCCVGDAVTLADLVLIPQVYNANRFNVDMKPFPKINKIVEYLTELPAFVKAHPDNQSDAIKQIL